jgi:hypothetical protein
LNFELRFRFIQPPSALSPVTNQAFNTSDTATTTVARLSDPAGTGNGGGVSAEETNDEDGGVRGDLPSRLLHATAAATRNVRQRST